MSSQFAWIHWTTQIAWRSSQEYLIIFKVWDILYSDIFFVMNDFLQDEIYCSKMSLDLSSSEHLNPHHDTAVMTPVADPLTQPHTEDTVHSPPPLSTWGGGGVDQPTNSHHLTFSWIKPYQAQTFNIDHTLTHLTYLTILTHLTHLNHLTHLTYLTHMTPLAYLTLMIISTLWSFWIIWSIWPIWNTTSPAPSTDHLTNLIHLRLKAYLILLTFLTLLFEYFLAKSDPVKLKLSTSNTYLSNISFTSCPMSISYPYLTHILSISYPYLTHILLLSYPYLTYISPISYQ